MCTALTFRKDDFYFARNLDLEYALGEEVTIMPRRFPLHFHGRETVHEHFAMIGTAFVPHELPLYYDATNEKGLSMAGLNFPRYARYAEDGTPNGVPSYELIPFVLSQCETLDEAKALLGSIAVTDVPYANDLPASPLHWLLADASGSVAVEPIGGKLMLTDDPVGVLTNAPPLSFHLTRLADFATVSPFSPSERFGQIPLSLYSRGMGTIGLPGDWSSVSRFIKAAFVKENSVCDGSEEQSVSQVFHILDSVAHPRGSVVMPDGRCEITLYSSCCNTKTGVYYYKTYDSCRVCSLSLHAEDLESDRLTRYPLAMPSAVFDRQKGLTVPFPSHTSTV